MMSHEEALTLLLAGGPVPLEAAGHLESCTACRNELEALKELESGLRAARPIAGATRFPAALGAPELRRNRRWAQTAAAAALLVGLLGGFAAGRSAPRLAGDSGATPAVQTIAYGTADDSTFALLSAAQAMNTAEPTDEELAAYLESHWGG